jgi:hypothetical protein
MSSHDKFKPFIMKFLLITFFAYFWTVVPTETRMILPANEGIETIVVVCGWDPDGNWICNRTEYDDGSDCYIVDNEGAPNGISFTDC